MINMETIFYYIYTCKSRDFLEHGPKLCRLNQVSTRILRWSTPFRLIIAVATISVFTKSLRPRPDLRPLGAGVTQKRRR